MPTLAVTPEPLADLRGRFPAALAHVYDVEGLLAGGIRPGECRANTFDFGPDSGSDGLRLLVSRERMPSGNVTLHVSASVGEGSPLFCRLRRVARRAPRGRQTADLVRLLCRETAARFSDLAAGRAPELRYAGMTFGGVLHFQASDPGGSCRGL